MKEYKYERQSQVTMPLNDYIEICKKQHRSSAEIQFRCPRCGTIQTANDLIAAGAGDTLDAVEGFLAFSCVGRFDDTKGCDWTLGGLFQIAELMVETPDGEKHPRFMPVKEPTQ